MSGPRRSPFTVPPDGLQELLRNYAGGQWVLEAKILYSRKKKIGRGEQIVVERDPRSGKGCGNPAGEKSIALATP